MDIANSSSDGEISNDLSDISEDDYFDNLASMIERRKLELELMNEIEGKNYDDYPKENRYTNDRNRTNVSSMRRRNNSSSTNSKDKSRNRSYRASSVFSSTYSMAKRRNNDRQNKKRRKRSKPQGQQKIKSQQQKEQLLNHYYISLSSNDEKNNGEINTKNYEKTENKLKSENESEEEDEELLALRLQALTSKQEVKELIEPNVILSDNASHAANDNDKSSSLANTTSISPNEEELLRIAALRSAVFKKKDQLKARKKLMKLENERPYSPTDIFEPIAFDDAMELSNSPFDSPFNSAFNDEINQEEIDMDISNSYPATPELETSDMELVLSPQKPSEDFDEQKQELSDLEEENEEDLRSKLLLAMNEKKKDQTIITKNLKMAVERLKQLKQPPPLVVAQKSGNKTIKMILEEKTKKTNQQIQKQATILIPNDNSTFTANLKDDDHHIDIEQNSKYQEVSEEQMSESFLLSKITSSAEQETYSKPPSPSSNNVVETSFSTITDTKNIPLLPQGEEISKFKERRLITSLESVIKPVSPLVITLQAESSEDEYTKATKKNVRRVVRAQKTNEFEQSLDSFLKNIRMSQEQKRTQSFVNSTTVSNITKEKDNQLITGVTKTQSAVKHLPLSSQMEYENLLKKMEILQQKKKQRHQLRQLKRTKSSSSSTTVTTIVDDQAKTLNNSTQSIASNIIVREKSQQKIETKDEKKTQKGANKIDDTLSKISLLDEAARHRLIEKTENIFRNHSKNLLESTEKSLKVLEESSLQMKQRRIVETKIQELEKSLVKYRSLLKIVNNRIKTNIPKVIHSQNDVIKFRNRQHNFKDICKRVGENVRGNEYRPPDHQSNEITNNFSKISEKTEELHDALKEQYASKQLKLLADKVKSFISDNIMAEDNSLPPSSSTKIGEELKNTCKSLTKEKKEASDKNCVIESSDNQTANNNVDISKKIIDVEDSAKADTVIFKEQIPMKRIIDNSSSTFEVSKKLKLYDSPLEYLKDNSRSKSVNQVVCPFALEGSCNDEKCAMLHL